MQPACLTVYRRLAMHVQVRTLRKTSVRQATTMYVRKHEKRCSYSKFFACIRSCCFYHRSLRRGAETASTPASSSLGGSSQPPLRSRQVVCVCVCVCALSYIIRVCVTSTAIDEGAVCQEDCKLSKWLPPHLPLPLILLTSLISSSSPWSVYIHTAICLCGNPVMSMTTN